MKMKLWVGLLIACAMSGCTATLHTAPDRYRTSLQSGRALPGYAYSLPMRQYSIEVTRSLSRCPGPNPKGGEPFELEFSVEVKAPTRLVAGEHYVIDYSALSNWMTTSSFAAQTHESTGTLRSINASADNQANEIISAAARAAFAVAGVINPVSGLSAEVAQLTESVSQVADVGPSSGLLVTCTAAARTHLANIATASTAVETATAELSSASAEVTRLTRLGVETRDERALLYGAMEEQERRKTALEAAKAALTRARAPVTITSSHVWPSSFGDDSGTLPQPADEQMAKLLALIERASDAASGTPCSTTSMLACLRAQLVAHARLERTEAIGDDCEGQWAICVDDRRGVDARVDGGADGLFVRPPAEGQLIVCRGAAGCQPGERAAIHVGELQTIPQLGQLRFIPFRNRIFEHNQLVISLRNDGTVEKFEIQSRAAARQASTLAADLAGQALAFRETRQTQREEAEAAARTQIANQRADELAEVQHDIDLLNRQRSLATLQAAPAPAPDPNAATVATTAAVNAELALARARLEHLRAEEALAAALREDDD